MKKSTLIMILSLVLAISLGLGGTLAYLTDDDGDVNVMTVGYVTITQNEQERVEIGNPEAGLDEFTQNKAMNPAVVKDHSSKETIDANGWEVKIRDQVSNYVDKIVSVTNTGANDAYVRTIYAIPEAGDFDTTYKANEQWLHWNGVSDTDTTPANGWIWGKDQTTEWPGNTDNWDVYENVEIEGKIYDIYIATNKNVLAPKKTTAPSLLGMFIDEKVDCDVNPTTGEKNYTFGTYNLGDISTLDVLVLSQAVQADGFDTAWEAFDAAFPTTKENLVEWLSNIEQGTPGDKNDTNNPPVFATTVSTADELKAALPEYGEIALTADITADAYNLDETVDTEIILDGNTMSGSIINYGDMAITGEGVIESDAYGIENHGTATITDVTVNAGSASNYALISVDGAETTYEDVELTSAGGGVAAAGGAQVTFKSGTVAVNTTSTSGRYNFYAQGEGTVITIEGGEFSFSKTLNQKRAYICAMDGTTVYVKGGTFGPASTRSGYTAGIITNGTGSVVITGGTFGFDPSTWVADGYQAVKTDSTWTVSPIN